MVLGSKYEGTGHNDFGERQYCCSCIRLTLARPFTGSLGLIDRVSKQYTLGIPTSGRQDWKSIVLKNDIV